MTSLDKGIYVIRHRNAGTKLVPRCNQYHWRATLFGLFFMLRYKCLYSNNKGLLSFLIQALDEKHIHFILGTRREYLCLLLSTDLYISSQNGHNPSFNISFKFAVIKKRKLFYGLSYCNMRMFLWHKTVSYSSVSQYLNPEYEVPLSIRQQ